MPEKDFLVQLWGLLPPLVISVLGGLVRAVRTNCTFKATLIAMLVAAFTGVVVSLFLQDVAFLTPDQKAAVTGLAGYNGGKLLDILSKRTCELAENLKLKK
ncbi:phage holin family protein [Halodesulfovibrio aestuarii]|uniref:LydA holin phage, holin superfamily III n=1 Tax=Halodesulfovibrio aestuarii TaxID=126333 RepID=A0A8G2FHC6_9BACT|nr:phage holin family protein [Halodesulfovibrio aestuarii]SHI82504.1 LydA holin phage, holin superfamily III [Halodesulfovibrio aestuarii]